MLQVTVFSTLPSVMVRRDSLSKSDLYTQGLTHNENGIFTLFAVL